MNRVLLTVDLRSERDIVAARRGAREVSARLGFEPQDQARIATTVSELARNAIHYAGSGQVSFAIDEPDEADAMLRIEIADQGPGIESLERAQSGPASPGGEPKLGLVTARRMMDAFEVDSAPGKGARIRVGKRLPRRARPMTQAVLESLRRELAKQSRVDAHAEIEQQNRELLRTLGELRSRQEELVRLNSELEDTNRGVLALYAELDERATHLRMADESKTRFLSNVSHELRTPVNSILALSRILLDRLDGELSGEQERQVGYIRRAAEQLSSLIDDLLDLRKVEAGKLQLRIEAVEVVEIFGALRAMFRPLTTNSSVALVFHEPEDSPQLCTDHGKVSQILRNLISNALKFTERGAVEVFAAPTADRTVMVFTVKDTGIGISPENHRKIFDEFTQVENPLQRGVKGAGLGLPLSLRLATLLGGTLEVHSDLGKGATFSLAIPVDLRTRAQADDAGESATGPGQSNLERVLIVDDDEIERYALRQYLPHGAYDVTEASGGYEGLRLARQQHPDYVFLDLVMPDINGMEVLRLLKSNDDTRKIPVVIFTSQRLDERQRQDLSEASALVMKNDLSRETVADALRSVRAAGENMHAK
jgi:signal transduction histidine kinase